MYSETEPGTAKMSMRSLSSCTRAEMENAEEAAQELDIAGTAAWIVAAGLRKVALQLTVIFVPAWCMSTRAEPAKPSCPNRARSRGSAG